MKYARAKQSEQLLINAATPGHISYGHHMTRNDIQNFTQPSIQHSEAVNAWLKAAGIQNVKQKGTWINFEANVTMAEHLLDTKYYYFHNGNQTAVRTLQYSIPTILHDAVMLIQPTTRLSTIRPNFNSIFDSTEAVTPPNPTGYDVKECNRTITPDCLRGLYQIGNFTDNPSIGNKLGISGYLDQYARHYDLEQFTKTYAPYAKSANFSVEYINGGLNLQNSTLDGSEAAIDIQYGVSLAYSTPVTYYSTGGLGILQPDLDQPSQNDNQNEPYLEQLQYLLSLSDEDLPSVLSTSYGEDEQSVPPSYAKAICHLFAQLGARGVSVIFSSADTGVGSACQTNDGRNTTKFLPTFPASCPFVTSVGGTWAIEPEIAASFSSGGFSDLFPRPQYQEEAVCKYLDQLGDRWDGLYNRQGRGIPDVSAQSFAFLVYNHNITMRFWGTSCAAPVFAAIIANMNSIRISIGLPSLGFLNPFLYGYGYQGLTDITTGGSTGCTGVDRYTGLQTPFVPYASWNATPGWDPVTGLGTPIFPRLVELMFQYTMPGNFSRDMVGGGPRRA